MTFVRAFASASVGALLMPAPLAAQLSLEPIGTYATGIFDEGAAEIAAYDPETQRLFVINGGTASLDVIDIRLPSLPRLAFSLDLTPYGGAGTSVDVYLHARRVARSRGQRGAAER